MNKYNKLLLISCMGSMSLTYAASITQSNFGVIPKINTPVALFTLKNNTGMEVDVINYRGIITKMIVPGAHHQKYDVVLGHETLGDYLSDDKVYMGVIVGRYAGRIKDAKFSLNGHQYHLANNDHGNDLHSGGRIGFNNSVWQAQMLKTPTAVSLKLSLITPDGDQGFPGMLHTTVTYTLPLNSNHLMLTYTATTDKPTVINLSDHSYFNLEGEGYSTILDHKMMMNADSYTVVDSQLIPTGEIASVTDTPFDFKHKLTAVGARINMDNQQLKYGLGYDLTYVLNQTKPKALTLAATLVAPISGVKMSIYTTEPALQFYSGNHMNKSIVGLDKHIYDYRSGFVFETEHYPDAPNHANFPSTVLNPGQTYKQVTIFKFNH